MLGTLVERQDDLPGMPPIRFLLLDRHSGEEMTWWEETLRASAGNYGSSISEWYRQSGDLELEPLAGRTDRTRLLKEAAKYFLSNHALNDSELETVARRAVQPTTRHDSLSSCSSVRSIAWKTRTRSS